MVVLDIILMALISAAIVGFLAWSVLTQHRHVGCEHLRVDVRRPQISIRFVPLNGPTQLPSRGDPSSAREV